LCGFSQRLILVLLHISCAAVDRTDPNIKNTGAHDDGSADANPHQMVQGELSFELPNNADEPIVQCLEHIRQHDLS
jgi:hypothetical protein